MHDCGTSNASFAQAGVVSNRCWRGYKGPTVDGLVFLVQIFMPESSFNIDSSMVKAPT
jgi:hypothetical protein